MSCSLTISPSKLASRILTIFGCLHSVKILISVKKHSKHSFLFTIFFTLIIFTATYFFVFISIASFTFAYLPSPIVFIISYFSSNIFLILSCYSSLWTFSEILSTLLCTGQFTCTLF